MTVDPATSISSTRDGRTSYFCHPGCREKFEADPGRYLDAPPSGPPPPAPGTANEWVCPMHPQIVRPGPGECPICGMALEPRVSTGDEEENPGTDGHAAAFPGLGVPDGADPPAGDGRNAADRARGDAPAGVAAGGLDRGSACVTGRALGRLALLPARLAIGPAPQPQHVHADRSRRGRRLCVQPRRHVLSEPLSRVLPEPLGPGRRVLRGGRGHRHPRLARPGPGAPGAVTHGHGDPRAPEPGSEDRPSHRRGRIGEGCAAFRGAGGRPAPRPAGGEGSRRRRRRSGGERRRRVDGHRRIDPGRQVSRRPRDRRHGQRDGLLSDEGGARRLRDAPCSDRSHGRGGAAKPRADPEAGRRGVGLLRSGRDGGLRPHVSGLEPSRAGAASGARRRQRGGGADHRLPVRARTGDADVHHGGERQGGDPGRPVPQRRGDRDAREGGHPRRGQDRNADGRTPPRDVGRPGGGSDGGGAAADRRESRTRKRAPPRSGDRAGGRKAGDRAVRGPRVSVRGPARVSSGRSAADRPLWETRRSLRSLGSTPGRW